MKPNRILAVSAAVALAFAVATPAQAQFGGLLKKAAQSVKNQVRENIDEKKRMAEDKAKDKMWRKSEEVKGKAQQAVKDEAFARMGDLSAPEVNAQSSLKEAKEAFEYWVKRTNIAIDRKDLEWLVTADYRSQLGTCMGIFNKSATDESPSIDYIRAKKPYEELFARLNNLLYAGRPNTNAKTAPNVKALMQWCLDKAQSSNNAVVSRFYALEGLSYRYLYYVFGQDATEDATIEQIKQAFVPYWDTYSEEEKEKYPNSDPNLSYAELHREAEKMSKFKAKAQKEREAKRKAQIEASKQTLTPGALDAQLNAQVLRVAKQKVKGCLRVVVINDAWAVHRKGGVITDRALSAWVVYRDQEGNLAAHDYSFCQDYMGGGTYGNLRYKGIGMSTVYVK